MLHLTESQFNELYPDLKGHYRFFTTPPPDEKYLEKYCLPNKLWRLNNIYTITNKDGDPVTFRMNYAQHVVYAASRQHPRVIILKSRQQGISTLWLVSYFDDAVWAPFMNTGLMAQGTDEAATLLERVKFLWDTLSPDIKQFCNIHLEKDNTKEVAFSNRSSIFIRVSFRSATLQRLHVSEMGKIANMYPKRAKEVSTGTLQALGRGNTGVIESTAEGNNRFKKMWDAAVLAKESGQMSEKDFYPCFLSWVNDPDCVEPVYQKADKEANDYFETLEETLKIKLTQQQKNFWIVQRRELAGEIYQEYPGTPEEAFTIAKDGTYYSRLFKETVVTKGRVRSEIYDPNLPVDVYFDLGVDDYGVMIYMQWYRGRYRIIEDYWNNGYALSHYMDIARESGYAIRALRFPHDIAKRELGSAKSNGLAKQIYEIAVEYKQEHKLRWRLDKLKKGGILDGIEATRRMIPNMEIDPKCKYTIECLLNYSKEWDDKLQAWKKTPKHDEYSHGADVLRQIASNNVESASQHESELSSPRRSGYGSGAAL